MIGIFSNFFQSIFQWYAQVWGVIVSFVATHTVLLSVVLLLISAVFVGMEIHRRRNE